MCGSGYGVARLPSGRQTSAHRVAYLLCHGDLPPVVLHTCDNRLCVNPQHLRGGTQRDNIHDMIAKGRHATGARLNHRPQRGAQNHNASVTRETVDRVRFLVASGVSQRQVARQLGLSKSNVWAIVHEKTWTPTAATRGEV